MIFLVDSKTQELDGFVVLIEQETFGIVNKSVIVCKFVAPAQLPHTRTLPTLRITA